MISAETASSTTIVSLRGIRKSFPGVQALSDVDLDVLAGEVHGLVGKNGAGKSTLVRVLMGLLEPDAGSLVIYGRRLAHMTASEALAAGVAYVPQHVSLMDSLSVAENILAGQMPRGPLGLVDWTRVYGQAEERLRRLGLDLDARKNVEGISVAEQTMLAIAQALFRKAKLVILDEPTAALPRADIDRLFAFIRSMKSQGIAIVFISHHLEEVFEICDRVTVLRDGRRIGTSTVKDLDMAALTKLIVGENVHEYVREGGAEGGELALQTIGLTRRGQYEDVSIDIRKGEIVGLCGLMGSGAEALGASLFGLERKGIGSVRVGGREYTARNPHEAFAQGVALLPQDRYRFGLVGPRSIRENVTYTILDQLTGFLTLLKSVRERHLVKEFIEKLGILTPSQDQSVRLLSGGNQQKVVFAKLATTKPSVLILHDPTQGIDVRAKLDIYRVIDNLSKQGIAILIISTEVRELVGVCDRILVMYEGRLTREFRRSDSDSTPSNILLAIEGGRHAER
jgi:ABC-type sugar transport system ATPase subunit